MLSKEEPTGKEECLNPPEGLKRDHELSFEYLFFLYKIFAMKIKISFTLSSLHPFQKVPFDSALLSQKRYVGKGTAIGIVCEM